MEEDPFESPKSLLQWASDDLPKIYDAVRDFLNSDFHTSIVEDDPDVPGGKLHKIKFIKAPPATLRRDIQRVTDELKKALDQGLHHAIRLVDAEPRGNIWFPWATDPTDLDKRITRDTRIPQVLWPVFRAIKPYPAGDHYSGGDNLFRALGKVSGPSRHQTTLIARAGLAGYEMNIRELSPYQLLPPSDGRKDEIIIAGYAANSRAHYDLNATFFVAFDHASLRHAPADGVLRHWEGRVRDAVRGFEKAALANRKS